MKGEIKNNGGLYLILLFIAGAVLRAAGISAQSIGPEEFTTARFASASGIIALFWESFQTQAHFPLFYMLEHLVCMVFGYSETSLRLLPLLFGIASMPVFYRLVRAFFNEKISLAAFFLFALNPYQIYYSQQALSASMFLFVSLLITYYFLMSVKYNAFLMKPFIVWSVIGVFTNSLTVILLIIFNLIIFIRYREEIRLNLWIKAQVIIFCFMLLALPFILKGGGVRLAGASMLMAPFIAVKNYLFGFTADFNFLMAAGCAGAAYLIIMAALTYRHKNMKIISLTALISFLYPAALWAASIFGKFIYPESGLILTAALVLVLLAIGISYLSREGVMLALSLMFIFYSVSVYNFYVNEKYKKTDYKKQYEEIVKQAKEGAVFIHSSINSYQAYEFYNRIKHRSNFENRKIQEPSEAAKKGIKYAVSQKWEKFREKTLNGSFKLNISSGYDPNMITSAELSKKIKDYKEVWFVKDNSTGIRQPWLSTGAVWHSDTELEAPLNVEGLLWVRNYFNIKETKKYYGAAVYKMERR
ncbi:MAG TPA: glycosyltransferase family 39 protein [Candidatus Goldiibacteriota bacterium]|nr:glycosyltransferase family 39 protein [Candidatus Goldiibacteriota bacterium]